MRLHVAITAAYNGVTRWDRARASTADLREVNIGECGEMEILAEF